MRNKIFFTILAGIALILIGEFFVWGCRPRINPQLIGQGIGGKYKTLTDVQREFGPPLFSSIANINEEVLDGYAYADRFIKPHLLLVIYADRKGEIVKVAQESLKRRMFYFPQNSRLKFLMFLEFVVSEKLAGHSNEEMKIVMEKLFPGLKN